MRWPRTMLIHATVLLTGALSNSAAFATGEWSQLRACAGVPDRDQRLACFDALVADADDAAKSGAVNSTPPQTGARVEERAAKPVGSSHLSRLWELDPGDKNQPLTFRPHRDNYLLLANYSRDPNSEPYRPFQQLDPSTKLNKTELAFQLGFKLKLLEQVFASPVDLWFGYTQRSFWQAYNSDATSPFRETNYEPELMAVAPLNVEMLGWRARLLNVGLVHQSNGQAALLSRSWNRMYAQVGLERGNFTVLARLWKPVGSLQGNEDIRDYYGDGDVVGTYRMGGQEFSVLARSNFKTGHGALQASWAFPLKSNVKGYVQVFNGYGDSLINYNASQQTVGLGVLIAD